MIGHQNDTERRSRLFLGTLPILFIPLLAFPLILSILFGNTPPPGAPPDARGAPIIPIVVLVVFLTALIVLVRLGKPTVSTLLLIGVWTGAVTLLMLQQGVTSNVAAMLLIPICVAGLLLDGTASVSLAALATMLMWSAAWLEQHGAMPILSGFSGSIPIYGAAVFWTTLFWMVAAITRMLAGGLQQALAESRAQAAALGELSSQLEERVAAQTVELEHRAQRAEAQYQVSRALARAAELPTLLKLISEQAARLLQCDAVALLLADAESGEYLIEELWPPTIQFSTLIQHQTVFTAVVASMQPQVVPLAARNDTATGQTEILAVPMRYADSINGVLALLYLKQNAPRSSDDLHLASGLADQAAVAIANAQLLDQVREGATLEERTRLARDIHDTIAQDLTGIAVQLGAVERALTYAPDEAPTHTKLAQQMARQALAEARRSVWNLRAPALERGTLADALRGLAEQPMLHQAAVHFMEQGDAWPLSAAAESTLLRVGQESLVNATKHAGAQQIELKLSFTSDAVELTIADNGVGFGDLGRLESTRATNGDGNFGIVGMRERVQALGGKLELQNDGGAVVRAIIPRVRT